MMGGVLLYAFAGAVLGGIDSPFGAVDAAQHRAGEGVEENAAHHVGIDLDDRRGH